MMGAETVLKQKNVIGIDLGGTKLFAGVIATDGTLLEHTYQKVAGLSSEALVETLVVVVERLQATHAVAAIGLGIPSLIDQQRGVAVTTVNLPLADVPIREMLAQRVQLPVAIENDANAAAVAEWKLGAGKGCKNLVLLTVGTGIGGGLVLNNMLVRGALGAAGELGHTVIDYNGPPCQGSCPNRGCLETLASGTALMREANGVADEHPSSQLALQRAQGNKLNGELVLELARRGDPLARGLFHTLGQRLGVGIANFVNLFNPDVVVLGGGMLAAGDLLLEPARKECTQRALSPSREHVRIVPAAFHSHAGMVGAGLLAQAELRV